MNSKKAMYFQLSACLSQNAFLKAITRLVLLLSVTMLTGCGTFSTALGRNGQYYLATYRNCRAVGTSLSRRAPEFSLGLGGGPLFAVANIATVPAAVVFDTLLIPSDYLQGRRKGFFVEVIDDAGHPVPSAIVRALSMGPLIGKTDEGGLYRWASDPLDVEWVEISKSGYYSTRHDPMGSAHGGLSPCLSGSNTVRFLLKRVVNPIPMYAKETGLESPVGDGSFGYDLIVGDAVEPYGRGKIPDLVIHLSSDDDSPDKRRRSWTMDITFSHPEDGIRPFFAPYYSAPRSELRSDHEAPSAGYYSSLKEANEDWRRQNESPERRSRKQHSDDEPNYYFRVRSDGSASAMYGKIYGPFRVEQWGGDTVPHILFMYFLNADRTRNVEFAPGRSFFPSSGRVGAELVPAVP